MPIDPGLLLAFLLAVAAVELTPVPSGADLPVSRKARAGVASSTNSSDAIASN